MAERRDGRYRFYSIDPTPASQVVGFVAQVYQDSLDELRTDARVAPRSVE